MCRHCWSFPWRPWLLSYLVIELWFFLRCQGEIPCSQICRCSPWGRVNLWHSYGQWDVRGDCWGFWARYLSLKKKSHRWRNIAPCPPLAQGLEVGCGTMWCLTLPQLAQTVGTLRKQKHHGDAEQIRSSDFTDWLNQFQWLPISRLLVIWEKEICTF